MKIGKVAEVRPIAMQRVQAIDISVCKSRLTVTWTHLDLSWKTASFAGVHDEDVL